MAFQNELDCPRESYTISHAICRARQARGYHKCKRCRLRREALRYPDETDFPLYRADIKEEVAVTA